MAVQTGNVMLPSMYPVAERDRLNYPGPRQPWPFGEKDDYNRREEQAGRQADKNRTPHCSHEFSENRIGPCARQRISVIRDASSFSSKAKRNEITGNGDANVAQTAKTALPGHGRNYLRRLVLFTEKRLM
jgi:hypothetical protein